jgi:hypothetical protein
VGNRSAELRYKAYDIVLEDCDDGGSEACWDSIDCGGGARSQLMSATARLGKTGLSLLSAGCQIWLERLQPLSFAVTYLEVSLLRNVVVVGVRLQLLI